MHRRLFRAADALDAVIVMVTSAVDVLTLAALKLSGLPAHRVLGRGTVLGPRGSVT